MRITNAQATRDIIARLAFNSAQLAAAQNRASTGLKVQVMSDDPVAGSGIMQTAGALRGIEQYRRNVSAIGSELAAEDSALSQVSDLLSRAKELAAGQGGATASTATRRAASEEVKQIIAQVVQIGNTKIGDTYLFGGANAALDAPFDVAQTATAPLYVAIPAGQTTPDTPAGMRVVEVAPGQTMAGAHDGATLLVQSGVLASLQALDVGLSTDDPAAITAAMSGLDTAFSAVQTIVGDVGARGNRIDSITAGLDALTSALTQRKSDLSEVDMEQAITEMIARQTAYQAAMMASSRVMGMSLADYLR